MQLTNILIDTLVKKYTISMLTSIARVNIRKHNFFNNTMQSNPSSYKKRID